MSIRPTLSIVPKTHVVPSISGMSRAVDQIRARLQGLPLDVGLVMDRSTGHPMLEVSELNNGQVLRTIPMSAVCE